MAQKATTRPIPAPLIREAFRELTPIIEEVSGRFPAPGHPLAPALLRLINWTGRAQMKLDPWLNSTLGPRPRRGK
jgi:hypothetical protein